MQLKKYIFFITFILIALFLSCEDKEWENPFDANSDPKSWAPENLQIEQLSVTKVKLTWEQEEDNISGFKIDRKIGEESWQIEYAILDTNITEWIDSSAVPVAINYYRVYSFANENKSSVIEKSINPSFPAPTDLQINQLSDLEVKLIWKDNSTGEDGFKIDKKIGSNSWILAYGIVGSNIEEWIDTEPVLSEINYYRVYGYSGENKSSEIEGGITFPLPAPTNLTAYPISYSEIRLTWIDNCSFESGYKVERKEEGGTFTEIADLSANTESYIDHGLIFGINYIYRIRAYTTNNTSDYSEEVLPNVNVFVDIDDNVYAVVKIGTQVWMAENLKVTHYRTGDPIPNLTDDTEWSNLTTGAYCNYDNDAANVATYGRLYNWYAVADSRNIAPEGWHVPTDEEWKELEMYIGMSQSEANSTGQRGINEGSKLKSTSGWFNNGNGTDDYGFSALPGGYRSSNGGYVYMGSRDNFWSSTGKSSSHAWTRSLRYGGSEVTRYGYDKRTGCSVRCVRD